MEKKDKAILRLVHSHRKILKQQCFWYGNSWNVIYSSFFNRRCRIYEYTKCFHFRGWSTGYMVSPTLLKINFEALCSAHHSCVNCLLGQDGFLN